VTRAKVLEYQLDQLTRMVEDVLGRDWANHVDGQKLKGEFDALRVRLNTHDIVDEWIARVKERPIQLSGPIFNVEAARSRSTAGRVQLQLKVRCAFLI
jgi:dynein heavy chain 1